MIGNDIVDLNEAARTSNWKRPRYLDKIFTNQEQEYIAEASEKDSMIWLLWSMKEAAYKVYVQQTQHRFFQPKKAYCSLKRSNKGLNKVEINGYSFKTASVFSESYLFTSATSALQKNSPIKHRVLKTEPLELKNELIRDFAQQKKLEVPQFSLSKNSLNIPKLQYANKILNNPISLTHHGKYAAYSYCL